MAINNKPRPQGIPLTAPPDLTSVPDSLSSQLDKLDRMVGMSEQALSEGDNELARIRIKQCYQHLQTLAETSPEYSAVLAAAMQGHTGLIVESVEKISRSHTESVTFMGVEIGHRKVDEPTVIRKQCVIRVF